MLPPTGRVEDFEAQIEYNPVSNLLTLTLTLTLPMPMPIVLILVPVTHLNDPSSNPNHEARIEALRSLIFERGGYGLGSY